MKRKGNGFINFCLAFMPGAAHMYMGFMKKGASLLALFLVLMVGAQSIGMYDFSMICGIVMWCYSFFEARNLAKLNDELFQSVEDEYVWKPLMELNGVIDSKKVPKYAAYVCIVVGCAVLWNNITNILYRFISNNVWREVYTIVDSVPRLVIGMLIIYVGYRLIVGKKQELDCELECTEEIVDVTNEEN